MTRLAVPAFVAAAAAFVVAGAALAGDETDRRGDVVELGRRLFFEPAISRTGRIACASCHDPEHGWTDAAALSLDEDDETTPVRAPPTVDLDGPTFGWSGEFASLEETIEARIVGTSIAPLARAADQVATDCLASESDGSDRTNLRRRALALMFNGYHASRPADSRLCVPSQQPSAVPSFEARLAPDGRYERAFAAAFGDGGVSRDRIVAALAAFLRSVRTSESPFDRFRTGHVDAIPAAARRGYGIFAGKAACAACHSVGAGRAAFTDRGFHEFAGARTPARTPSLRDVARRAPYFRDGSAETLAHAVRLHPRPSEGPSEAPVASDSLSPEEIADLAAFLSSLSGDTPPGAVSATGDRTLAVHVERPDATPNSWIRLRVRPAGQRLAAPEPSATEFSADENGDARIELPPSTHVVLEADGHDIAGIGPIPDTAGRLVIVVASPDEVTIRVRMKGIGVSRPATLLVDPGRAAQSAASAFGPLAESGDEPRMRICPDATDFTLYAAFSRAVSDDIAIYVLPRPGIASVVSRTVRVGDGHVVANLDLAGGAANTVDFDAVTPSRLSSIEAHLLDDRIRRLVHALTK